MALHDYKALPSSTGGLSLSSPTSAWGYSSYGTITSGLSEGIAISGITFMPDANLGNDTDLNGIIELYSGASDTLIARVPFVYKRDTSLGHVLPSTTMMFAEPIQVGASNQIRARIADESTTAYTYGGVKIFYRISDTSSPSVTLSSPASGATTSDTTPTLDFTGTDTEGNDIRYNTQISTNTFSDIALGTSGSQITDGTPSLTVSTLSTTSKFIVFAGNHQGTVTGVTLNGTSLTKMVGAATAFNETAEIWYIDSPGALSSVTLTGSFSGGTGRFLAYLCLEGTKSGVEDVEATATGSNSSPTVNITPTAKNSIVLSCAYAEAAFTQGAGETNIFNLVSDSFECGAGSYDIQQMIETQAMNYSLGSGQRWAICAVAIAPAGNIVVDAVSGTDSGFANPDVGGDTDPFISGDNIEYTVQSALSDNTYYWRVRGIDPNGYNAWGSWSTARNFVISATDFVASVSPVVLNFTVAAVTALAAFTASASPVVATFSVPNTTATYQAEYTASVSPVSVTFSVPSVNASFGAGFDASVSPAGVSFSAPNVTATYQIEQTASVTPVSTTFSVPSVTATYESNQTTSVAPVNINLSVPAVTASYQSDQGASVVPVATIFTIPAVTSTYQAEFTASVSPVSISFSVPSVTATQESGANASVSPADVTFSVTSVTATYESNQTASVTPITIAFTVPTVTSNYQAVYIASVSPVVVNISVFSVTSTYQEPYQSNISPVIIQYIVPAVTATYDGEAVASVVPTTIQYTVPTVTADYGAVYSANVSPHAITFAVPGTTATYEANFTATVSPVIVQFIVPTVTAASSSGIAQVSPSLVTFTVIVPTITFSAGVETLPVLVVFSIPEVTADYCLLMWTLKQKESIDWGVKSKTSLIGEILTSDESQILVGEDEDQVLIYEEGFTWASSLKEVTDWGIKDKSDLAGEILTPDGLRILVGENEDEILVYGNGALWGSNPKENSVWSLKNKNAC